MTPTVEHALAKFQNASEERQEKLARIMLIELEDVRDEYDQYVDSVLEQRSAQIEAGQTIPAKQFFTGIRADMKQKYG